MSYLKKYRFSVINSGGFVIRDSIKCFFFQIIIHKGWHEIVQIKIKYICKLVNLKSLKPSTS